MQQAVAFEVEIKSPCFQSSKSPAQIRLESRTEEERSPKTTDQLQSDLENAAVNRQMFLQARAEKSGSEYAKAKAVSAQTMEAFQELTNQKAQEIDARLSTAEANRAAQAEKVLEKTKNMNLRVESAQKKKGEMDSMDKEASEQSLTTSVEKLSAAEVRRSQLLEETKAKNAAEVAKAKELAAKKQQSLQEMDEKLQEKLSAAEERRNQLLTEQKERAAAAVEHAKQVAATRRKPEGGVGARGAADGDRGEAGGGGEPPPLGLPLQDCEVPGHP
eukprot:CAMPEP_0177732000 /NCGR_PEP_ID=MMETSP0484_2-20121128/22863_1 /TAXON_ID=354590 /ORGANISM="Rhodomonas lens, Strain RHODO" /LENGTH=273 /DNA_ID=CAMNT_0019245175 /DNA_START=6 /DNA_END=825 /DNA_ORIENTATION=+